MKRSVRWLLLGAAVTFGATVAWAEPHVAMDRQVAPTHPIVEPDWRALLDRRVQEAERLGLFEAKRRETLAALTRHRARPVEHPLPPARQVRVTERALIADDAAERLPEATRQALATLSRRYVLFDGDRWEQRVWAAARARGTQARLVVATGALATPKAQLVRLNGTRRADPTAGMRLFADQGGVLARRFGVAALPAVIELADGRLRVIETPVPAADEAHEKERKET